MANLQSFRVLASIEVSGCLDTWTEYLCLQEQPDGSVVLSRRGYPIIAVAEELDEDQDGEPICPDFIDGVEVTGFDGEYVFGGELVLCDDDAEVRLWPGDFGLAYRWLEHNGWHRHTELFTAILMPTKEALSRQKGQRLRAALA